MEWNQCEQPQEYLVVTVEDTCNHKNEAEDGVPDADGKRIPEDGIGTRYKPFDDVPSCMIPGREDKYECEKFQFKPSMSREIVPDQVNEEKDEYYRGPGGDNYSPKPVGIAGFTVLFGFVRHLTLMIPDRINRRKPGR